MSNKKYVVEYTDENPVYNEGRAMCKIAWVFIIILMVLSYVF